MAIEGAGKVVLVDGPTSASKTIIFDGEDHTLGNALRHVIMSDPSTSFCGYSMPHPSETRVQMRVQTKGEAATEVASRSLGKLAAAANVIGKRFDTAISSFEAAQAIAAAAEADSDE